jgi:SAM-dependent methyltransferase
MSALVSPPSIDPRQIEHRRIWNCKPTLRFLYADYHRRLLGACSKGPIIDIGGGTAHIKAFRSDVVSVDMLPFPGIDLVTDAHRLPFRDASFGGIVMLDVLHHLERPIDFLREAARVLQRGGVLAMIEPGMSTVAYPFYDKFHQEPADMSVDPFAPVTSSGPRDPFDSNQAIPTLLFRAQNRDALRRAVPELKVRSVDWLSLFAFPLSGGFKSWCLVPPGLARALVRMEDAMPTRVKRFFGFRLFAVLERS